ncbi:MAG TPA: tail fiber domain-containing protein, partial [Candidatus Paceibacterota bacterium]|nr:tail fiber domain-containing protein [Candidatus Paceibacterota bacterium]
PIFTTPSLGAASASSLNISGLTASKVIFTDASKNLTSTGIGTSSQFIKGDGSLDSNTYLTGNQTVTLSGDISGSGTTAITTTIGAGKVTNAMLTGSIAASKLVGTDIATVGTITSGVWQGTPIVDAYIASASTWNAKQNAITLTTTGTSGAATFSGGTLNIPQYTGTTYAAGTGLTLTGNTFSVNTTQNISTLSNLTTDGLIKTSGGTGALSIATAGTDYLTPTGSGALLTGIPTSVTNSDGTLTISPTTGSVVASLNLANANTWTAQQAISIANIGATPTSGLSLTNTTAAAAGAQQYSPSIHFTGQGWKTSAPAASEPVDMQMYLTPSQSTGTPASALIITSSLNGGAYSQIFSLSNGGTISIPGNFSMSGTSLFTSAIGTFKSVNTTTTALATTSTDGVYLTNTTAATSGVPVQYSPRVRWSGAAWTGSASQAADFIAEVKPVNGTSPVTAKWVLSSQINSGGYNPVFTVADNGYIGIGTTAPVYLLDVGNASVSGAVARFTNSTGSCTINPTLISFSCSSDQNLKKNITDLEDISTATSSDSPSQVHNVILNDILSLRPVTYNWKTENDSDPKHTGFIAQEVQQIFPDLVSEDPTTGYLSLNYIGLIPYTIQAIQEMNIKISPLPDFTDQSLADTVRAFLTDVAHGIVRSKELCADQVCVTSTQLQQMLDYIQAHQDAPVLSASTDTTTDDSSTTATGNNSTLVTPTIGSTTTGDTTTPPTSGASSDTASPAPTSSPGELIQGVSSSSDTPTQNSSDTSISSTDTAPALPTISS